MSAFADATESVGVHMIARVSHVRHVTALRHLPILARLMRQIVDACRLTVVAETGHQFLPVGATHVFVLSESHCSVHTYPERAAAYIDLFVCDSQFEPAVAAREIEKLFQGTVEYRVIRR